MNIQSKSLLTEKNYADFGKKVASVLYQGQAPYRIPVFFKEALKDVQSQLESKRIKEILDMVTTLYNEKVKEEKEKDKAGKSKAKKAPQLVAGKNTVNQQMMHDLMGEDDYGDEDDYGEDVPASGKKGAKKKIQEDEFDFM
jgi:Translation initiation factor eIF3 subunit